VRMCERTLPTVSGRRVAVVPLAADARPPDGRPTIRAAADDGRPERS
jgi:hypothetical protein